MSEDGAADDSAVLRRQRGQTCPRCGRAILSGDASVVQAYCLECRDKLRARIESVLEALERSSSEALKSCELGEAPPPASIEKLKSGASLLGEKIHEARGAGVDGALLERARACWIRALEAGVSARKATLQAEEEEEKGDDEGERQEKLAAERAKERQEKLAAERAKEADRRLSEEQARFRESMADAAQRKDTPPWMTGEKFVSSLQGPVRIKDTALRGVSLKQVLSLADYVRHCLQSHNVIDTDKNSPTEGQRITWESLNMYQVCTQFVMPLTREHGCSYVELIGEGDSAEGVPPLWMASHWWGTTFAHTVNMLKCHAQARYGGTDTHSPEETTYWICTLANNQHDIDNELNEDDMMHTPFARAMLKASCQGTVLLCDPDVRVLERAWCILEIHITEQLRRMPSWAPDAIQATDGVHFLDVVSPVTARDLPEGLEEPVGGCSAMFVDVGEAGWHEHTTLPGIHFPLRVAQKGVLVNMVRSEASRPEDWRRIMNFIAFKKVSDGKPPAQNQEYVKLNLFIHEVFFSAELFRLCLELPEDAVSRAKGLIMKGANPNNIVRCGHTPLFAAVGAEQFKEHDEGKKETQKELVEFLLDSRADPNVANSSMNTALDCARDGDIERLLKGRSCKTFGEMAPQLEKAINKQLKDTIKLGCGRLNAFSGSGGGGVADKLSAEGLKSLQSAAALMHRYPGAPCTISVRQQRRASMTTAEREAMARARKVEAVLQGAGCQNPFRLETAHDQVTPLPPAVAIEMNLQKMDEIKNFGGALLLNELAAGHQPCFVGAARMSKDGAADDGAASAVLRHQRGQTCPRCGRTVLSGDAFVVQACCLDCHGKLRARIESDSEALERSSSEALKSCELGEAPPPASIEKLKSEASLLAEKIHEARGAGVDGALLERARACCIRALEAGVSARQATLQAEEEEEKGDDEGERQEKLAAERAKERQEKLAAERAKEADRRLSEEQARFRESMADAARREDTPPWVTGEKFVSSLQGPVRIKDTALRGVSLKQVLSLADYVRHCLQSHDVIDTDKNSPTKGQRIRWESLNMYQVCTQFVMPLTREHRCSYVELIGKGDSAEGVPPLWMASHWWGTTFAHTVNMLKCHAQARYGGIDTHSPEETTYWICTLANNQHDIKNELIEDDMIHTPFARAMLKASCQGTVLLCDPDVRVLERAWCILEIHITEQLRRMPSWAPDEIQATDGVHFLDVVSPVTARDLPEGLEEPVGGCSAMFVDVGEAGWHEHTTLPGIHFPLRVAQKGVLVNMVRSEASRPEDWRRIMNFIAFKKVSDGKPPAQNQEYVKLNLFIHEVFFSAELFRLCLELPEDAVSRAKELIMKGANPNNIVRCGHTPLFAAVGAEQFQEHDEGKKETQKELVEFLLDSRADPNVANSSMNTALDCARDGDIERLLKGRSCKTFSEMAPQLEKAINKQLKGTIKLGCGRLDVFSGSGGGGVADKLSAEGLKSLQSAAALMHRYPGAPCTISVRQQRRASMTTAEVEAMARARKVEAVLQGAGCRNPFRLETAHAQVTPLPPAVAIKMNLQKMDEIKNFGGALLLNELAAESDSEPAQESESESELSTGSDWDRVTRIFKKCDSDGSGTISREELERVLLSLKPDLTQEQMIVMFNCADADHNGEIDLGEFLAWINSSDPTVSELKENSKVSSPQSTQALGDSPGRRSLQGSSRRSTRSRETPRRVESALDA